jgi:hypothetical protein
MKEFFEGMAQRVKEIESDPNLVLLSYHVPAPVAETTIAQVEQKLGIALNDDWKSFFRIANGFQLRWADKKDKKYNPKFLGEPHTGPFGIERVEMDEETATGCVNILPLEDIFLNKPTYLYGYDPDADPDTGCFSGQERPWRQFHELLYPFDIFHIRNSVAAFVEKGELLLVRGLYRNSFGGSRFCDMNAYLRLIVSSNGNVSRKNAFKCFEEEAVPVIVGAFPE